MGKKALVAAACFAALGLVVVGCAPKPGAYAGAPPRPTTTGREVELTIYSQDFALVHEKRDVNLTKGSSRLVFRDVSKQLDPHSVLLRWQDPGKANPPEIVGHSYDLGVEDSQDLLKHEIGKPVEIVRYGDNGKEASRERGKLLVAGGSYETVVEVNDKLYVNPEGTLVVPGGGTVPTIPQLTVQVESEVPRSATIDLAYLTRGLRWSADYVATLAGEADDRLDLECYATVTNRTTVEYPEANIMLVAGSPSRAVIAAQVAQETQPGPVRASPPRPPLPPPPPPVEWRAVSAPESVAEFHTYTLKRAATIHCEQLNRLLMLRRDGLKVKRDYAYRTPYLDAETSAQEERGTVTVAFSFVNSEQKGMGVPLPQGAIRVYDPDRAGRLRYAGAAEIPPTPKNKKVNVTLASAFDVTAEYKTLSSKKVSRRTVRKEVRVLLRNEKTQPIKVRVVQGFWSGWRIVSASEKHVKLDSSTAQWTVNVPANGEKKLTFAVDLAS